MLQVKAQAGQAHQAILDDIARQHEDSKGQTLAVAHDAHVKRDRMLEDKAAQDEILLRRALESTETAETNWEQSRSRREILLSEAEACRSAKTPLSRTRWS